MTRYALPLLLLSASLLPGCFCIPHGGCFLRAGDVDDPDAPDMMDCGPCPDDPELSIPLPWKLPVNSMPAPQTPLTRAPSGAAPRVPADASAADGPPPATGPEGASTR